MKRLVAEGHLYLPEIGELLHYRLRAQFSINAVSLSTTYSSVPPLCRFASSHWSRWRRGEKSPSHSSHRAGGYCQHPAAIDPDLSDIQVDFSLSSAASSVIYSPDHVSLTNAVTQANVVLFG